MAKWPRLISLNSLLRWTTHHAPFARAQPMSRRLAGIVRCHASKVKSAVPIPETAEHLFLLKSSPS
ncbi:hypothetical protein OIDMADRAFT_18577 [Oidiodendron maius Zn]|uniref:Uncharacterized protein n=1 Tax=Oidiodendron maius (strain Zn) TaxID=913774 RepID=A0A0C3HH21_OIDMZ|nr:hypothetical protein OIDMADRAFT_18577 [Oidiodendron maius Zn]